jgi:hypothetical protein
VWTAFVVGMVAVLAIGISRVGAAAATAAEAQSVADLAALAGVDGGRPAATAVVAANDGRLASYREVGGVVTVSVRVRAATATASATWGGCDGDDRRVRSGCS